MGRAGKEISQMIGAKSRAKETEEDREAKSEDLVATRMIDEDALSKRKPKRTNEQIWYIAVGCAGVQREKRIDNIIDGSKLNVIATEETKLAEYITFNLPNYNAIRRDWAFSRTSHVGVAIFVYSSTPYNVISLDTPVQAVAVQVQLHTTITICNMYSPGSQELNYQLIENIYRQLPQQVLMVGDFTAQNAMWGSTRTCPRGREIYNES